jgi:hypothetical protein
VDYSFNAPVKSKTSKNKHKTQTGKTVKTRIIGLTSVACVCEINAAATKAAGLHFAHTPPRQELGEMCAVAIIMTKK